MSIVIFSFALFAAAFALHWLLWRVWRPKRQIVGLLYLFNGLFGIVLFAAWLRPDLPFWPKEMHIWPWLHVALFYEAVSLAYIVAYSALEQDSPSMTIVVFVADAGGQGRTREELYNLIGLDFIIGYRFESMLHSGLIEKVADVYRLTPKGFFWARLFLLYRRLFRLQMGG
jgi:hypothetical protein